MCKWVRMQESVCTDVWRNVHACVSVDIFELQFYLSYIYKSKKRKLQNKIGNDKNNDNNKNDIETVTTKIFPA